MKTKTIITGIITVAAIAFLILPSVNSQSQTYPFENSSISAIKAQEIGNRGYAGVDGNIIHQSIYMNFFINVTGAPTGTYTQYNYQTRVYYDSKSNSLKDANNSIQQGIKDYAKKEWNFTMSNSQMSFIPYVMGNNI